MLFRQFLSVKEDPYKKGQNLGCQKNYRGEGVVVGEERGFSLLDNKVIFLLQMKKNISGKKLQS